VKITPAKTDPNARPKAEIAWSNLRPDRILAIQSSNDNLNILSHDGSLLTIGGAASGPTVRTLTGQEVTKMLAEMKSADDPAVSALAKKQERPDRLMKLFAGGKDKIAVAYWGGTLRIVDRDGKILTEQQLPQDITAMAWWGAKLIAGLADGRVMALEVK
jgi:hypothetical protein